MKYPVRILYVHHGKGIGGAPLSLLYLIRGLPSDRFHATVACLHESEASEMFRAEGIDTIVLRRIKDFSHTSVLWYPWWQFPKIFARLLHLPFAIDRARRFLVSGAWDIVHLNTSTLLAFGIAAARERVKVVWHVREPVARGYFGLRRNMVRRIIHGNASAVIPICRYDASQLIESDKIHVVYNSVDRSVFNPEVDGSAVRKELGLEEQSKVVLFLGGVNRIKGALEFVRAAIQALESKQDVRFLIAGTIPGGGLRNELNGSAAYRRKIMASIPASYGDAIRFLGVRNDIPALLAASSVLCFPSIVPHFARPVIEASALGKPVVASDLGGPQELVLHEKTGLLVAPFDTESLAGAIVRLLDNPDEARRFGASGIRFAEENFDAEKNTAKVIAIYEQLLNASEKT